MKIVPLGDSALIVRLRDELHAQPELAVCEVIDAQRRLQAAAIPGVVELAPAYASIGVFFDPALVRRDPPAAAVFETLTNAIVTALAQPTGARRPADASREHELPVCCEGEFAPDLQLVADLARLTAGEVVDRYCAAEYYVHCVGFLPGFPYLGGLPPELAAPRRATPRTEVPARSVAIGGAHTGIYPTVSPGGWNIIGRTTARLFDPHRERPSLLAAGDRVRFRKIPLGEFQALSAAAEAR